MLIKNISDTEAIVPMDGFAGRVMIGQNDGAPNFAMRFFEFSPGFNWPLPVKVTWEHEVFILSGKGVIVAKGKEYEVKPMDFIYISPDDEFTSMRCTGKDLLRFICVVPLNSITQYK